MRIDKKQINSIGLAIFLSANPISWIFPFNSVIVFVCLLALLILLFNNKISGFFNSLLFLVGYVIVVFFFSMLDMRIDYERLNLYFTSFLVFGITGILYSQVEINYNMFYKSLLLLSLFCLPIINSIDSRVFTSGEEASGFYMGVSYGILRFLLAIIIVLSLFRNKKILFFLTLLLGFFYLIFYFNYGTRGAVLGLLVFLLLFYLLHKNSLSLGVLSFTTFSSIIALFFFEDGVLLLSTFLEKNNITIEAIDKMAYMINSGIDLSNGRNVLLGYAFNDLVESPFFGLGISSYENKYNIYVHNFLIQGLYEGGVIMFTLFITVLLYFIKLITSNRIPKDSRIFLIFIFCSGIMELLFSNVLWRSVFFWYFVCLIFVYRKKFKNVE